MRVVEQVDGRRLRRAAPGRSALALLAVTVGAVAASISPAATAGTPPALRTAPPVPVASVAVRSGDPAPVTARVPYGFACRLAFTATNGKIFADGDGSAVMERDGGATVVLAYAGEPFPGGVIGAVCDAAPAPDGSVFFRVQQAAGGDAILRRPPGGGPLEVLLASPWSLPPPGDTMFMAFFSPPAVDGAGRALVNVSLGLAGSALVRLAPGADPEVLLRDGDPLGGGTVQAILSAPAANTGGVVAFAALLTDGSQVVATLAPGMASTVLQTFPAAASLYSASPAINDAGDVTFLWYAPYQNYLQRISGGVSRTIAAPGSPAPGGDTFAYIGTLSPAIDSEGGVIFSAYRSSGGLGLYRFGDTAETIAEAGGDAGGGRTFVYLGSNQGEAAPAVRSDGTILFAAQDTLGSALFSCAGATIQVEVRAGDPLAEPARFARFGEGQSSSGSSGRGRLRGPIPFLSAGPFLSPGGNMIFDAWVTSGVRGLFLRQPDGTLAAVAIEGDAAPGGGHYDPNYFAYHSVNAAGTVAFLGAAPDGPSGASLFISYGPAAGPLVRLIGFGDAVPGSDALVSGFQPPSRVNAAGALAIPAFLSDGTVVLLGWDGAQFVRVAGPGDVIPGQGAIQSIATGASGGLLPPLLDDDGNLIFGAVTAAGGRALYEAPLRASGVSAAIRLLGEGDPVEGGLLTPFNLSIFDHDADGRLAFQAIPAPATDPATYLEETGAAAARVAGPGDIVTGVGTVGGVLPHMTLAGEGRLVHQLYAVSGMNWLLLSAPEPAPGSLLRTGPGLQAVGDFVTTVLAGPGLPSPDGGAYQPVGPISAGPGFGSPRVSDRLATDGRHLVAWVANTTAGPQEIVLFDLNPNRAPVAIAGPAQVVECAGPSGTPVTLDGSGSTDPDGDPIIYEWSGPFGTATGPRPVVTLPLGDSAITLTVSDPRGASSSAAVDVLVQDTMAPSISVRLFPAVIWPPDGHMATVLAFVRTTDVCDAAPVVLLTQVTITDRKGADPAADISGADIGTDDRIFQVRATRSGGGDGRTYTATYSSTDHSGNTASASAAVLVPQTRPK